MSKIFGIRPADAPAGAGPATDGPRALREVLRLIEEGGRADDFARAVPYTERTGTLLRAVVARYGFERLPATWSELYGLFEYCDSLDAAAGVGMTAPEELGAWQAASFVVWRRKDPQRMPAIERYCAGDLDGLRELHRREDTLTQLGLRYLAAL